MYQPDSLFEIVMIYSPFAFVLDVLRGETDEPCPWAAPFWHFQGFFRPCLHDTAGGQQRHSTKIDKAFG